MDRIDIHILELLTNNARVSNKELAAAVGLAPSSCHERVKTLWRDGVLRGFHADVNLQSLGLELEALLFVQVSTLDAQQIDNFVRETAALREVRNVFLVSGHFDLLVHVAVKNMGRLKLLISENFNRHKWVRRVETAVIFNRETQHGLPVDFSGPKPGTRRDAAREAARARRLENQIIR